MSKTSLWPIRPSAWHLLALAPLLAVLAQAQTAPGDIPLDDVLQVVVLEHELLALDARGGGNTRLDLRLDENVLTQQARGQIAVVLTDRRVLAVGADSGAWQQAPYRLREAALEEPLLGDRVALILTGLRVLGFDGGSGNLVEQRLGPGETVLARAVDSNVAVVATARRALGLSPFTGGFFEVSLRSGEKLESVETSANLATVRTSRRLLTFRAPSGSWGETRLGLGN